MLGCRSGRATHFLGPVNSGTFPTRRKGWCGGYGKERGNAPQHGTIHTSSRCVLTMGMGWMIRVITMYCVGDWMLGARCRGYGTGLWLEWTLAGGCGTTLDQVCFLRRFSVMGRGGKALHPNQTHWGRDTDRESRSFCLLTISLQSINFSLFFLLRSLSCDFPSGSNRVFVLRLNCSY